MLFEFTTMHEDLRAKRADILHSEIQSELLQNSEPKLNLPVTAKNPPNNPTINVDVITKRPRVDNTSNWHPKLKTALQEPLKTAGNPTFTKIMKYCKKDGYNIFPKGSSVCTQNTSFGTCFFGEKCTKRHKMATDAQVKPILTVLEEFIKKTTKLQAGQ